MRRNYNFRLPRLRFARMKLDFCIAHITEIHKIYFNCSKVDRKVREIISKLKHCFESFSLSSSIDISISIGIARRGK